MKDVLMPIAIIGSFGASIFFFTRIMTNYILRKKMIDKGFVNEDTQAIFKTYKEDNRFSALKWGFLALFGGLALIIMEYLEVRADSTMPYGIMAVSLSLGFLLYYFVVKKENNK